jgi:murein DD-endopeptidase MepM/ murein hydrolase activator NlpD
MLGLGLPFIALTAILILRPAQNPTAMITHPAQVDKFDISLPRREPATTIAAAIEPSPAQILPVPVPPTETGEPADIRVEQPDSGIPGKHLTVTVKSGDSLDRIFGKNGLDRADLATMLRQKEAKEHLRLLRPGDRLDLQVDGESVIGLRREIDETRTLILAREGDSYRVSVEERPLNTELRHASGRISTSLFEAGKQAGISDALIMNLAGIFAWDIDFALDIRTDDEFLVLYEEVWQDGQYLRDGKILAAEFVNSGKTFRAIRYETDEGRGDYFTPEGRSVRKAFLRAPVDFARVSSNFNPRRLHPVLKIRRPHNGVDYAAPTGTIIKAAGDGKVIFRGKKGGYGNCVIIQHGGNITTLYAHMSRFAKSARVGKRVRQGQTIGYVGATGMVTAAHLHYEYRVNGVHRNPRTVKLPEAEPIPMEYREAFLQMSGQLLSQLDLVKRQKVAVLPAEKP